MHGGSHLISQNSKLSNANDLLFNNNTHDLSIHWVHNYRLKVSKGPTEGSQRKVHEIPLFDKAMNIKITCTSGMKLRNFNKLIE